MSNEMGQIMTFWELVKRHIMIPTLQRDYIYGATTPKTDEVLNNMLDTFRRALETNEMETLDFIYGSDSKAKEFMPLDGQQRLTTLFLLHFYAAIMSGTEIDEEDFKTLGQFSYATRNCTIAFCDKMLIHRHKELSKHVTKCENQDNVFVSYLTNLDDFRGSFYTDPSVMSMMVVLDRIHKKFHDMNMKDVWEKLTGANCPINFYLLDFGVFDLSDDLYNKMNSRGKPLTAFEIFKAKMHKRIMQTMPEEAEKIAEKMDTNWMQFVWESIGQNNDFKLIDSAFMNIIQTIFRTLDYISGSERQEFPKIDDCCLDYNMQSVYRILSFKKVMDVFSSSSSSKISSHDEYISNLQECVKGNLKNSGLLYLYATYVGLLYEMDADEFDLRFRHVRNLVNNSTFQIREANMPGLLCDVKHVMQGKLNISRVRKLNSNSWEEEQEKDRHRDIWRNLFEFEDINEINGTLQAFSVKLNDSNKLDLSDSAFVSALTKRLKKAAHFFKAQLKDESKRRSALLSLGNYAQSTPNYPAYRYFGILKTSWQNFTGFHQYSDRDAFMDVIDKIDLSIPIDDFVGNASGVTPEHWRYYAIKYAGEITVGYRQPNYGYMYFPKVNSSRHFDETEGYLDVCILQSSYYGPNNIAWKMINRLLDQIYISSYYMYLDPHGGDRIHLVKISNQAALDIQSDGWHVYGINLKEFEEVGLRVEFIDEVSNNEGQLVHYRIEHEFGKDLVIEGAEILEKLAIVFPSVKK